MESLKLSFQAVMPIFLLMLLGYCLKSFKIADKKVFDGINRLVFKAFLPTLLFYDIYKTDTADIFEPHLVTFAVSGILTIFILGYGAVLLLSSDNSKRGVMLQGFFRSNYAILGIPIVNFLCGRESGLAALMVAIVIPIFNVLAVICLESFRGGRVGIKKLFYGIITNPLIIGCVLGAVFSGLKITLPEVIEKAVSDVSKIASPLAIIVLGASFTFSGAKTCKKELIITTAVKLIISPLIMLSAAALLGFRGESLACLLIVFGAPTAVSSFSMAQQMGGDEQLASSLVVMSTAGCLITLFLWIFALGSLGLV